MPVQKYKLTGKGTDNIPITTKKKDYNLKLKNMILETVMEHINTSENKLKAQS